MPGPLKYLRRLLPCARACTPPPAPTGVTAAPGGGSGEVMLTWSPAPAGTDATRYRVYRQKTTGTWWLLAVVTEDALGLLVPGSLGVVDAPDYWPWPGGADAAAPRCYAVGAVSTSGLEGPMSATVCAAPL